VARDIDRKLRLTAALLGAITCKDLAAAFRRVNPATSFDVERAHKWLQGRARPRELQVYEDWAKLLDLGHPGEWIAECDVDMFLNEICAQRQLAPETLLHRAKAFGGRPDGHQQESVSKHELVGIYACYAHAWSPYFRGRLVRGALTIAAADSHRLLATYTENLPFGQLLVEGPVTTAERMLHLDLRETRTHAQLIFCLFPPTRPASILGGLMCGSTILGPEPQPSVTRIIMIRLPMVSARLNADAYLPPHTSLVEDLAGLGFAVAHPDIVEHHLTHFLTEGGGSGVDQVPTTEYRALLELFDRQWLGSEPRPAMG
jgi:hypothetical protein